MLLFAERAPVETYTEDDGVTYLFRFGPNVLPTLDHRDIVRKYFVSLTKHYDQHKEWNYEERRNKWTKRGETNKALVNSVFKLSAEFGLDDLAGTNGRLLEGSNRNPAACDYATFLISTSDVALFCNVNLEEKCCIVYKCNPTRSTGLSDMNSETTLDPFDMSYTGKLKIACPLCRSSLLKVKELTIQFECPVCLDNMNLGVECCVNKHILCVTCHQKIDSRE